MGMSQRVKGHSWERAVSKMFREIGFKDAKRHLEMQFADCQGYDIDGVFPWLPQCKAWKDYAPISKIEEVKRQKGGKPLLITKGDRKPAVAVLYLEDFLELLEQSCHGSGVSQL